MFISAILALGRWQVKALSLRLYITPKPSLQHFFRHLCRKKP
jgi:hypothetical protein